MIGRISGIKDNEITLQVQEGVRIRDSAQRRDRATQVPVGFAQDRGQGLLAEDKEHSMERSWWWKAALYGVAIILAVLYLVPTVVTDEAKLPAFFQKYFKKRIQLGLDLQGGLHLVYEVNIEKAVSSKVDRLANDVEDALKKKGADVTVVRDGRDDIAITFKIPAEMAKLDDELLKPYRRDLDEVGRDPATGTVKLRYDSDRVAEVEELALRQAIETIRGRVDEFGVAEPTIIKKGTDIVVELPGAKAEGLRAHQEHHRPHRPARVQDRRRRLGVHEEGGGRRCPRTAPSRSRPNPGPRSTRARSTRTSTCA